MVVHKSNNDKKIQNLVQVAAMVNNSIMSDRGGMVKSE